MGLRLFLVVVTLVASGLASAGEIAGKIEYIKGQAEVGSESHWLSAEVGMVVEVGQHVRTGESSRIRIRFVDGSSMQMGGRAEAVIERYAVKKDAGVVQALLDLIQGRGRFIVEKLKQADSQYQVRLRAVLIGVRGTDILAQSEAKADHVALVEGRVSLTSEVSREVMLDKGYYARAESGKIQKPVSIPDTWLEAFIRDVGLSSAGKARKRGGGGDDGSAPSSVIQQKTVDKLGSPMILPR